MLYYVLACSTCCTLPFVLAFLETFIKCHLFTLSLLNQTLDEQQQSCSWEWGWVITTSLSDRGNHGHSAKEVDCSAVWDTSRCALLVNGETRGPALVDELLLWLSGRLRTLVSLRTSHSGPFHRVAFTDWQTHFELVHWYTFANNFKNVFCTLKLL